MKRKVHKPKKFRELSPEEQGIVKMVSKRASSGSDVMDILKELFAPTLQEMMEQELESHLGYAKHSSDGIGVENSRNGYSKKILKGSLGETEIQIPRDRLGDRCYRHFTYNKI